MSTSHLTMVLGLAATGLMTAGFYCFDWQPRAVQLGKLDQQIHDREAQRDELRSALAEPTDVQDPTLPEEEPGAPERRVTEYLSQACQDVTILSVTPDQPQGPPPTASLAPCSFQARLSGRFDRVLTLLEGLGRDQRMMTVHRLSLTPYDQAPGRPPLLSVELPVTAYVRR